MSPSKPDIKRLFEPQSVAVIGASSKPGKIGFSLVNNIVASGYQGKIFPINPSGGEVLGLKTYKSLLDIPGEIDIVLIAIPAKYVLDAIKECAEKKVAFVPIITSGFSEIGNTEVENKIASIAKQSGMRILGPNIFGIYSATGSINATFGPKDVQAGNVAIITQSGALGIAMIGKSAVDHIGLSSIVSIGNKCDIDEADLLEYLINSDQTKSIMMYMEGIQDGPKLTEALKKATRKKPVIVIKSGRSKRGAMAAASHTGSLAGSDEVFDAIMRQCGVLRADSIQEAFDWCKFLSNAPTPKGRNTVIITNGGGVGVMATDACEKYDIRMYNDNQDLQDVFGPMTPDFGSTKNPIDITGQASAQDYTNALKAGLECSDIHATIALYCETALFDVESMPVMIEENYKLYQAAGKPILYSLVGGPKVEQCIQILRERGVPVFSDIYNCVACLGGLYKHYRYTHTEFTAPETPQIDISAINTIVDGALDENRNFLLAHEGQALMEAANIPMPANKIARNINEAVTFAEDIGYPVVMKIVSRDVLHKSDAGGVALDLENKQEVMDAFEAIMHNVRRYNPDAKIDGIEICEMVESGVETIIGARLDNSFGPTVMFGLGGIYVEVMKDVAFRALPLSKPEIMAMLKEVKTYPLLLGVRGEARKDIDQVVDVIQKVGSLLQHCPRITDIEVNPLMVYEHGHGVKAVDVRVLIRKG